MVTLQLDRVTARYGRQPILGEISTPEFRGGQVVALLGPNAAGKSTLFRRMFSLLKGTGEIRVTGTKSATPICYMPQDSGANAVLSVYESVLLASMQGRSLRVTQGDLNRVEATLDHLRIDGIAERNIGDLSGGQRQLVNAAQAIVRDPEILLMDEPTSALDLHRQVELLRIVRSLARDRDMLIMIAMHDLNHALRFSDQAMVLQNGDLIACGTTPEVVNATLLRNVWSVVARIEPCSQGVPQVIVDAAV